jgi:very-short-patch-repair endonuclease
MKRLNVDRARSLRGTQTDAERALWHRLRDRRLHGWKFRRQHEIDLYIVDFVCADAALVVELDGGQHGEQLIYDETRTRKLQEMGYRVLRFWNNDVLKNLDTVLEVIMEALASPAPHPNPLSPRDYLRVAQRGEGVMPAET